MSTIISLYSSKVSKYPQELISFLSEILPKHKSEMDTIEDFGATHIKTFNHCGACSPITSKFAFYGLFMVILWHFNKYLRAI